MTKTQAVKLIRDAFNAAPNIHRGFRLTIQDTLLDECVAAERQHRRGHPPVKGFSAIDVGKYFAVRYLRDYMRKPETMPAVGDYLRIRHECFTAAAIVLEFGSELTEWVASIPDEFDAIDYVEMMS